MTDIEYIKSNFQELADEDNEISGSVGAVHDAMDSSEFNAICTTIESRLNALYAKTRMLEEISDFAVSYVDQQIKAREAKFRERLKIIEDVTDSYRDTSSVSILVPFELLQEDIRDRDGVILSRMTVENSKLKPGGTVLAKAHIASISPKSSEACNNNSYDNILNGKEGSSFYITDRAIEGGLKETVTVLLKRETEINNISIEPVNAEVSDITPMKIDDTNMSSGFTFTLTCKEPQIVSVPIDPNAYAGDGSLSQSSKLYKRKEKDRLIKNMQKSIEESERKNMVNSMFDSYKYWNEHNTRVINKNTLLAEEFGI